MASGNFIPMSFMFLELHFSLAVAFIVQSILLFLENIHKNLLNWLLRTLGQDFVRNNFCPGVQFKIGVAV